MTSPLNLEPKTRVADLGGVIRFAPGSEFTRLYLMRDFETLAERYPREFVAEPAATWRKWPASCSSRRRPMTSFVSRV